MHGQYIAFNLATVRLMLSDMIQNPLATAVPLLASLRLTGLLMTSRPCFVTHASLIYSCEVQSAVMHLYSLDSLPMLLPMPCIFDLYVADTNEPALAHDNSKDVHVQQRLEHC